MRCVQPRSRRWWVGAREQFTRGAAIGSPAVQHSLRKQPRGPTRKQAEVGAADHSLHSERSHRNRVETKLDWRDYARNGWHHIRFDLPFSGTLILSPATEKRSLRLSLVRGISNPFRFWWKLTVRDVYFAVPPSVSACICFKSQQHTGPDIKASTVLRPKFLLIAWRPRPFTKQWHIPDTKYSETCFSKAPSETSKLIPATPTAQSCPFKRRPQKLVACQHLAFANLIRKGIAKTKRTVCSLSSLDLRHSFVSRELYLTHMWENKSWKQFWWISERFSVADQLSVASSTS